MGASLQDNKMKQISSLILMKDRIRYLEQRLENQAMYLRNAYKKFGRTFEQFAPFADNFPTRDLSKFKFIGQPIDGIIFDDDKIVIIEIKTGNSQLTPNQLKIKQLVEQGKVEFKEVRYNDKNTSTF